MLTQHIISVTPEKAAEWLENHNSKNRMLSKRRVETYADAMRRGRWKLSPDGIAFDGEGVLMNGQHRLQAVVEAGVPVSMVVWRGVDSSVRSVMDQGMTRRVKDDLQIAGIPLASIVASAEQVIRGYLEGSIYNRKGAALKDERVEFISRFPTVQNAAEIASSVYARAKWQKSAVCAFASLVLLNEDTRNQLETFIDKLVFGDGMSKIDPILIGRNQHMQLKAASSKVNSGIKSMTVFILLVKMWNDYCEGKTRTKNYNLTTMPKNIYGCDIYPGDNTLLR